MVNRRTRTPSKYGRRHEDIGRSPFRIYKFRSRMRDHLLLLRMHGRWCRSPRGDILSVHLNFAQSSQSDER